MLLPLGAMLISFGVVGGVVVNPALFVIAVLAFGVTLLARDRAAL